MNKNGGNTSKSVWLMEFEDLLWNALQIKSHVPLIHDNINCALGALMTVTLIFDKIWT